jgi:hypothetical protein
VKLLPAALLALPLALAAPASTPAPVAPKQVSVPVTSASSQATAALRAALKSLSSKQLLFTLQLEPNGNRRFQLGSQVPFNPDEGSRTLVQGPLETVQVNPESPLPLQEVWLAETARLLGASVPQILPPNFQLSKRETRQLGAHFSQSADLTGSGKVSLVDLAILASNYGKRGFGIPGDLSGAGVVNAKDVSLFAQQFPLIWPK